MPECPNCHEYYFGNLDQCPKCYYHFMSKKVINPDKSYEESMRMAKEKKEQEQKIREEEKKKYEEERIKELKQQEDERRRLSILSNPRYEYETVFIGDDQSGIVPKHRLDAVLGHYADEGWRLHSVFTNEAGRNISSIGIGVASSGTNATVEVTVLIFERCVKMGGCL